MYNSKTEYKINLFCTDKQNVASSIFLSTPNKSFILYSYLNSICGYISSRSDEDDEINLLR